VYQEPPLPQGQAVTLKGDGCWYIDEIDGDRVDQAGPSINPFVQGNQVTATPGVHHIGTLYAGSNEHGWAHFTYNFLAGHTYAFIPMGFFNHGMQVVDDSVPGSRALRNMDFDTGPLPEPDLTGGDVSIGR
jgi:hypothetical protein